MSQLTMTGDDWTSDSDRDRKAQARAEAERKKAARELESSLTKSVAAMQKFINARYDAGDRKALNVDDNCQRIKEQMGEYASWLDIAYGSKA